MGEVAMSIPRAQIIKKDGKKEFAIVPYAEFLKMQEDLADYEDLRCLREAKELEKGASTTGLSDLKRTLRGRTKRSPRRAKTRH
jgi:hypothetical protein